MLPRIAGPLNCGTNNFQLEPAPCQEEDGKPEGRKVASPAGWENSWEAVAGSGEETEHWSQPARVEH